MKKIVMMFLLVCLTIGAFPESVLAVGAAPEIVGETAILIDASTGQVLFDKNAHEQRYPASTTKMITALLALENLDLSQTVVIDKDTPFTGGSRIYLLEGEEITVEQLLYALMLDSANDAAVALGKEMAGDIPSFAKMMNDRAKEIGALNTHFVNPHGLQEEGHVSTAYDLALIAREAMANEKFRELVSTYRYIIPSTNRQEERYLYNTNRLLYDEKTKVNVNGIMRPAKYEGVTGIKTGYTPDAGGCLVAGARREETELISVVMKATDGGRFGDAAALLDFGFANYKTVKVVDGGAELGAIRVNRGSIKRVAVTAAEDGYVTLPIEASGAMIDTKNVLEEKVRAPIAKGQKLGQVEIYEGDTLVGHVDAVATEEVTEGGLLSLVGITDEAAKKMEHLFAFIIGTFLLLVIIYVLLKRQQVQRRRRRRLARERRYQDHRYGDDYWRR